MRQISQLGSQNRYRDKINLHVWRQVRVPVHDLIGDKVNKQVSLHVWRQVRVPVHDLIGDKVNKQVSDFVRNQARDQVKTQLILLTQVIVS